MSYYDPQNDKRVAQRSDTRSPRLTLKQLHKLRKHRAEKVKEFEHRCKRAAVIYGEEPEKDERTKKVTKKVTHDQEKGKSIEVNQEYETKLEEQKELLTDVDKAYERGEIIELYGTLYDVRKDVNNKHEVTPITRSMLPYAVELAQYDLDEVHDPNNPYEIPTYCDVDHPQEGILSRLGSTFGTLETIELSEDGNTIIGSIALLSDNENARQVLDIYRRTGFVPVSARFELDDEEEHEPVLYVMGFDVVSKPAVSTALCKLRVKQDHDVQRLEELAGLNDSAYQGEDETAQESLLTSDEPSTAEHMRQLIDDLGDADE
ncbi:TPA: hypothetical protein RQK38_000514 [Vibrio vulnificus]|nr:hypothetical protein [Vibrio vulnificus]